MKTIFNIQKEIISHFKSSVRSAHPMLFGLRYAAVLIMLVTLSVGNAWGDTYTWTLASGDLGSSGSPSASVSKGSPSKTWSASYTWPSGASKYLGWNDSKGVQIGSGTSTNKCTKLVLSTTGISGTITNITVHGSHASSGGAAVTIKVGSTTVKSKTNFTTSDAAYSTGTISVSGTIEITIDNSASKAFYIKSIDVTYTAGASTFTVTVNSNNNSYGTVDKSSVTSVANNTSISASSNVLTVGSNTVTATPHAQDANYNYAFNNWTGIPASGKVTANVTVTANFTRTARTLTNYRTSCCSDPGLAYAETSVSRTFGASAFTNALTNSHSVAVTYASSDPTVATVNGSGQVTILKAGTTTITASSVEQTISTVTYCADNASYTLTVNKADITPTLTYSPANVAVGENSNTPSVGGNTESGGVTYAITSASPAGCATINPSTGVVTGAAVGSVTVTATIAATTNYNGNTATATVTITSASNFPNNKTIFIQAHSTSAWTGGGCVKAWFHSYGGSEAAQTTYWLFDAGSPDEGKKLFAAIVPSTGNLPYLDIQRFAANCNDWWNKNGGCSYSDADGSNAIRSTGKHDDSSDGDYIRWNDDAVTLGLRGDPDWNNDLATFADQGNGVWTATYNNYAPADAAGESQEFKICTNYNGWIGNSGSNNNVTVDGMHVGSTYNIGATLDIKDHSLVMTKTYVKGTVHFNLQGHGSAIADLTNVAAGSKISAPSAPTASGWHFIGWYKEPACTNAWNFASDVVNETMTLYAKWVQTFTVTYNNNGGSGTMTDSNSPYDTGATVTVKSNSFTAPTGKEFDHWNTAANNSGITYAPNATFSISANTTLYAQWRNANYNVTYSAPSNGNYTIKVADGTATSATKTANYNQTITIAATPSSGYQFVSWTIRNTSTSADVTSTLLTGDKPTTATTTFTMPAYGVTVTATFGQVYTVTFVHHDKGTYSGGSTEVLVPASSNTITLPTVTDVSCGFYDTFEGWITGSEYAESDEKPATVYAGGSSYTVTGNVTLRALYSYEDPDATGYTKITSGVTAGTYLIATNGGKAYTGKHGTDSYGGYTDVTVSEGTIASKGSAAEITVTMSGSTFAMHDGSNYLKNGGCSNNAMGWQAAATYEWELDASGNIHNTTCDGTNDRNLEFGNSDRFACYKHTQVGAFLFKKGGSKYCTNPSCVKPVGVHITYNANGGEMTCSNSNKTYKVVSGDNKYPQLASAYLFCTNATRTGYTLVGWNTRADGLGTTYDIDHSYSSLPVSGDLDGENWVTLNVYAMWASAVSFNLGNATGGTGVPAVVEEDGGFMLPEPTAAQIGTIPCGYSFYGWSASSVVSTTTKPALFMPGTKYTGASRTLYAVYRLAGEGGGDQYYFTFEVDSKTYCITRKHANYDRFVVEETTTGLEFGLDNGYLYYMEDDARVYVYWAGSSTTVTTTSIMPNNNNYKTSFVAGASGTTVITPAISGRYLQFTGTGMYGDYYDRAYYTTGGTNPTLVEATSYTYATNPSCETTATLAFVTNGGTLNYPDTYDASNYVDLTVGTNVYLPTATYAGEWEFEGWMKGSELPSQDYSPEGMSNFYTVTLNTTTYSAAPAGTTTFYAVYSKTVNDKQFDPVNGGTYKLFAIMSDGTTKKYMPVWNGTQTTLTPVTSCASTGDYTITPGTGVHAGQYQITHGSYTLGVKGDGETQFKNDADAWWNIEASTSGKGTYRITIVGSSTRCMAHSGTGYFSNTIIRNFVDNPSQPNYRDMEIGECIYTEYTSTPENIPYITITGSPVKITSTGGQRVYAPTTLHIEAHNFSTTRTIHFSATNGFATDPASVNTAANGAYSGDINIYYQPSAAGDGSIITSVLTASQIGGPAAEHVEQTFSAISGRNMPQDFVIAVKSGTQWYALPDDCHGSGTPKAVAIEVNDDDAPTAASLVPHNVEWRLKQVVGAQSSGSRPKDKMYFYEPNAIKTEDPLVYWNYALKALSAPNIGTEAQVDNIGSASSAPYEWGLTTSDLCAYTISNANVNKNISINSAGNFGTHSQKVVSETLYLLPITAYYEPAEFQVVEWKANSVVVMYLGNATQASVQVGSNDEGSNQTLSSVKVDHGVYELAASGLTSASNTFQPLQIVFKNAGGTEIGRNYVTIPAIVSGSVATSAYESVKDLAESNDVVILKGGTLTTTGTNTSAYKFANVTVYGGGKLVVDASTHFSVTGSLVLRVGGLNAGAYDYVYPQLNLGSGSTLNNSSGNFYYEYLTNYTQWFHMVLPFDAAINTIKYPTEYYGSAVSASNHGSWVIRRYAGEVRATGNYDAWKNIEEDEPAATEVKAGKGYIFWGVPKKVTANGVKDRQTWSIQRITITKAAATAIANENADKAISGLSSYSGVSGNSGAPNDQGWNLIGNPFMTHLSGLSSTSIQVGKLVEEIVGGKWTGRWVWDDTSEKTGYRYITIPSHHFDTYEAKKTSEFDGTTDEKTLKAGRAFFVQIAGDATGITFAVANKQAKSRYSWLTQSSDTDVETGIVMSNTTLKDEVNFWIKDGKTAEYEFNADYPKTPNSTNFNIYGVHSHGDLSWVAISPEIAEGSMAIGYQVPAAGTYTLSMSDNYPANEVESLLVTDHAVEPEKTVDLIAAPYEFTVNQAETNNTRFTVSVKLKNNEPENPENPGTGLEDVDAKNDEPVKFMYHEQLYILRNGVIYDGTGKKVREINK